MLQDFYRIHSRRSRLKARFISSIFMPQFKDIPIPNYGKKSFIRIKSSKKLLFHHYIVAKIKDDIHSPKEKREHMKATKRAIFYSKASENCVINMHFFNAVLCKFESPFTLLLMFYPRIYNLIFIL